MRYLWFAFLFAVVAGVSLLGTRGSLSTKPPLEFFPDMDRQPKYKPQAESKFFPDGMTDRRVPARAVPRGRSVAADPAYLGADDHLYRGYRGALDADPAKTNWFRGFPQQVTLDAGLMQHGRERYNLFCSPCHGQLGDGNGITRQYGMNPTSLLDPRIVAQTEGEIFNTITNGKLTMYPYGDRTTPTDRWAIIAYVRALQRAGSGRAADVPAANRGEVGL
jgi:mono/diheme cytochrome c family protein